MRRAALILAVATAAGLYFATQGHFAYPESVRQPLAKALVTNLVYYWLWAAAVPLVVWLGRRFPPRLASLPVHLVAAVALTSLQIAVATPILGALLGRTISLVAAFRFNFHSSLPTYVVILALFWAWDRERRARALEHGLVRARLDALRRQLDPHFLFNTLHAASSLMYTDAEAADAMLSRLAELLRASLAQGDAPEVPLGEELRLLDHYLAVEEVRLEDRLRVTRDIDPAALAVPVPPLILQALVENAVRHAIAPRPGGGSIRIQARRENGELRVEVADDGPGLPPGGVREGIGLANSRARLAALHGDRAALDIAGGACGVTVSLRLPWRTP